MSLKDKLRKAASYFVEMPPEEIAGRTSYNFSNLQPRTTPLAPEDDPIAPRSTEPVASTDQTAAVAPPPVPEAPRTVEQIVRESAGPNLEDIQVTFSGDSLPHHEDGSLDFETIYAKAGLPGTAFTAEQMIDMLAGLPTTLPMEMKRQTVQVTIAAIGKAIGATPDTIVADASRKIAAIGAYAEETHRRAQETSTSLEAEIAVLLAQAEEKRKAILEARSAALDVEQACEQEVDRLDDVLAFFSIGNTATSSEVTPPSIPTPTVPASE